VILKKASYCGPARPVRPVQCFYGPLYMHPLPSGTGTRGRGLRRPKPPPSGEFSPPPKHYRLSSTKFLRILSLVSNLAVDYNCNLLLALPPELQMLQSFSFQLQGASPSNSPPGTLPLDPHWGLHPRPPIYNTIQYNTIFVYCGLTERKLYNSEKRSE